ncbi:hypothetical protein CYMTET_13497, partial [Cymbomonas tetramitiformis]
LLRPILERLVQADARDPAVQSIPEALPLLATEEAVKSDHPNLNYLSVWVAGSVVDVIKLLKPQFIQHPKVAAYASRALASQPEAAVIDFLPQLVQVLLCDPTGQVEEYLMSAAAKAPLFAHRLVWTLGGEEAPPKNTGEMVKRSGWKDPWLNPNPLWPIVDRMRDRLKAAMHGDALSFFARESELFDAVTAISGILKPIKPELRRAAIAQELRKIQVKSDDLYLPTNTAAKVVSIATESGRPLQSAPRQTTAWSVPIMVTFKVKTPEEPAPFSQACIFKVGDDCRQDVLALQLISLLRDAWAAANLDVYVFPYGVLPTGYERGIIEVVPNSFSRNELGVLSDGGLLDMFMQLFGSVGSHTFEAARQNFIRSSAGYAVASFLLQSKDRHNGNLLIDKMGHLIHIDFGFIFEISPGGNLGFETAGFKLSHEMTQLLDPDGSKRSVHFEQFMHLCIQAYLVARQHMDAIMMIVELMADSGLPCYGRGKARTIANLRKRFHPELSHQEAAAFMRALILDAYDKWTTRGYDIIQYLQQGITH